MACDVSVTFQRKMSMFVRGHPMDPRGPTYRCVMEQH